MTVKQSYAEAFTEFAERADRELAVDDWKAKDSHLGRMGGMAVEIAATTHTAEAIEWRRKKSLFDQYVLRTGRKGCPRCAGIGSYALSKEVLDGLALTIYPDGVTGHLFRRDSYRWMLQHIKEVTYWARIRRAITSRSCRPLFDKIKTNEWHFVDCAACDGRGFDGR